MAAENRGRREEDKYGEDSSTANVTLYRLDQLERRFDEKLRELSEKLDDLQVAQSQVTLIDYRLKELEAWKRKFFAFLATVVSSIAIIWLTQLFYIIPKLAER